MTEEFHDINVELDDDTFCGVIELYIRMNFSAATVSRFKKRAADVGIDRDEIIKLAGDAVFNEACLTALEEEIHRKQKELSKNEEK